MSKIVLYKENATGVTTNGDQHAFFINENGLPTVKNGSQIIQFGTSGYAFAGSSGSSGHNGTNGVSGTSGISGTSGQNGAPGDIGIAGTNGTSGRSGTSGETGMSGTSGISYGTSGSSGANGLGAKSKAGTIQCSDMTLIDGGPLSGFYTYNVIFAEAFANTNYSISVTPTNFYDDYYVETANKTTTGFTLYWTLPDVDRATIFIDWLCISHGETGVSVAGTSGTSAGGGGIVNDILQTQHVGLSSNQPTLYGSAHQWRSVYGDGLQLDQGSGGAYNGFEVGFLQPFFLKPGETIEKVAFYIMDYISSGTGAFKLIICDKHPNAYLPWNILHSEELTLTHDGVGNKFVSWDYSFTNTGSTMNTYFFYILLQNEADRTFEICRTVQYPQHLTYDYRFISSSNRFSSPSHWVTAYHSIYNSLPATMQNVLANNFFTENQRGGHIYYQTSIA